MSLRNLLLLAMAGLVGCAPPPRAVESAPAETVPVEESGAPRVTPYDFESEGVATDEADDVQFEEDLLPPPENVPAPAVADAPVEAEDIESLPAIDENQSRDAAVTTPVPARVETPVAPTQAIPAPAQDPVKGRRGFRVQLVAVTELAEAERVAREARNRLAVETYVVMEAPYFKVRAGDFEDRAGAALLRDRARGNGYPQAWVTPTEIRPVQAP